MITSAAVPPDHPLMIAWAAYTSTEEFANTERWAVNPHHRRGSLWAAFEAGFSAGAWLGLKKAERMHRRAQRAEGDTVKMGCLISELFERLERAWRSTRTQKSGRQYQRQRADRWQAEAERQRRASDPLYRIIALGREFSAR